MQILIAGGTGFIGRALVSHWQSSGISLTVLGRHKKKINNRFNDRVAALDWDDWHQQSIEIARQFDIIINLCGENIGARRWSERQKSLLIQSRVEPTKALAKACAELGEHAPRLLNASGIGIYGSQPPPLAGLPDALDERSALPNPAQDFLTELGLQWERATHSATAQGCKVLTLRFAVALSKQGGVLAKMRLPFYFGLGGPIGCGRQPVSWVALADLVRIFDFVISQPDLTGPINCVAMQAITQREFAKAIGHALHRPSFCWMPSLMVKILFGQMGEELLLAGQHVVPSRLSALGFRFHYPDITSALAMM